jgi:hypothetical protein
MNGVLENLISVLTDIKTSLAAIEQMTASIDARQRQQLASVSKNQNGRVLYRKQQSQEEGLISTREVAQRLGVHEGSVRRWAREGCPRRILGTKMIRYQFEEVLAWLGETRKIKRSGK